MSNTDNEKNKKIEDNVVSEDSDKKIEAAHTKKSLGVENEEISEKNDSKENDVFGYDAKNNQEKKENIFVDEMQKDLNANKNVLPQYPNIQLGSLPSKPFMLTSLVLFVIFIAGMIVGLALQVDVIIKVIVIGVSAIMLLCYSLLFKRVINKRRHEYLQYAYDYAELVERDICNGELHKNLNDALGEFFEGDALPDFNRYKPKRNSDLLYADIECVAKNGYKVEIRFCGDNQLHCVLSVESDDNLALIYLYYAENGGGDKDGYARKPVGVLYNDIIEIIKDKLQNLDVSEEEV